MEMSEAETLKLSKTLFDFLYLKERPEKSDAIIGFGHFDMKIPQQCGNLFMQNFAPDIIFTGGIGAGTADLGGPEAIAFKNELLNNFPIPEKNIVLEDKSTNTGENIRFIAALIKREYPELEFGKGIKKVLIVSNAYRQRRVYLTCKLLFPDLIFINTPPDTTFENELTLFKSKNESLPTHLISEIERIINYPEKGFILRDEVPEKVLSAYKILANWSRIGE